MVLKANVFFYGGNLQVLASERVHSNCEFVTIRAACFNSTR